MIKTLFRVFASLLIMTGFCVGQTWHNPQRLTYTSTLSWLPKIAADSANTIHIVWADSFQGNNEIYYKNCTAGGIGTWSLLKRISWTANSSLYPAIAVDTADTVHIVWCEEVSWANNDLFHKSSSDGGATWGNTTHLNWSSGDSMYPVIVPTGNNDLRVFYIDMTPGNWEIYCIRQSFEGWGVTRLTWTLGDSRDPYAALDYNDDIHLVWSDKTEPDNELFHKKSTDHGASWSVRTRVTYSSDDSEEPYFVFDPSNNTMRLAWNEGDCGYRRVCFKNRNSENNEFYGYQRLTFRLNEFHSPTLAATSLNSIHIVYEGDPTGNYELYHKKSNNGGVNWTDSYRITWNSGSTRSGDLIASGTHKYLRLVYNDSTNGNVEIYFRRAE